MASIILSPKDIYEQDFKFAMRGYDKKEVDEFLDDVIKDYETFIAEIEKLRKENEKLKERLAFAPSLVDGVSPVTTPSSYGGVQTGSQGSEVGRSSQSVNNLDLLKRISRLEKEVFGKQITE